MTQPEWDDALDREPDNWHRRLVYSDWLEEQGDEQGARLQRWMVKYDTAPSTLSSGSLWRFFGSQSKDVLKRATDEGYSSLPLVLWQAIEGVAWDTRQEAEQALGDALLRLKRLAEEI